MEIVLKVSLSGILSKVSSNFARISNTRILSFFFLELSNLSHPELLIKEISWQVIRDIINDLTIFEHLRKKEKNERNSVTKKKILSNKR